MVALIHVQQLGEAAFATSSQNGLSVETILESATIRKAAFDVRNEEHEIEAAINQWNDDVLDEHFNRSDDGDELDFDVEDVDEDDDFDPYPDTARDCEG
ncbi:hypothetical protein CLAFUW4_09814 [Fulvia fulva]|uniref:Uncharacterized protein n=1 Tax=Passalora fulva TaxID=5499 RepID=A0A9Q8PID2_PASFU|nr:uncharacterized protein CLAFUR5_12424 [Fulvia fulva]KAK4616169.1 hypothetical protein CLAFUR4_09820 [Fulvia fulva]KAK4616725.1 hypothetical protein CLAFUR0_09813 [Fulvia fulva]UJO22981.1 hypothetical protein CLAFUR5_12424 [Fulvia fulva]WPV18843.1 hypothetical protein CLAFUW4_09814 [Fulvia fulva]WPV33871.1 hypothetical protein CLAFUW7_09817 [Fulvia fulva]